MRGAQGKRNADEKFEEGNLLFIDSSPMEYPNIDPEFQRGKYFLIRMIIHES